jgi:Tfp pilus assembly protein PilZ
MFFLSSPPVVDFVDLKDDQVVFLSKKPLRLGKDTPVRLQIKAADGSAQVVPLKVFLHQARPLEGGQLAYVGSLNQGLPVDITHRPQLQSAALRRGERMDCAIRVMSPDLPGFSAITVDFSLSGLQLDTRGALSVGQVVRLRLEVNLPEREILEVKARVAWCRPEGKKNYRAGLEFTQVDAETVELLQELETYLQRRLQANLTQRVLECADRYLLGYAPPAVSEVEA